MPDGFLVERHDAVFNVTIDRPDKDNTLTDEMLAELADLVDGAAKDEAIKAVALRGTGKDFSHGRDRTPGPEGPPTNAYERHQWVIGRILGVYAAFRACPVPVVAVVRGRALGFGCALVAGSDIAIASRSATFALPEMLHGIPPTLAISAHAKVAAKTVADLVYSAEEIGAEHALAAGLVSRIVDDDALDAATDRLLATIAGFERIDIAAVKRYIASGPRLDPDIASDLAGYTMATITSRNGG